jgi:hypothetical protein
MPRFIIIIIIIITGTTALCEPWPSSELFAILPHCRSVRLLFLLISKQLNFYGVILLASHPTPTWRTSVSLFVWLLPLDLSGLGSATSSYATVGIALRVSVALKHHHHDKVGIASVGRLQDYLPIKIKFQLYFRNYKRI